MVSQAIAMATRQAVELARDKVLFRLQEDLPGFEDPGRDLERWSGASLVPPVCPLEPGPPTPIPGMPCQYRLEYASNQAIGDMDLEKPSDEILAMVPDADDIEEVTFWFHRAGTAAAIAWISVMTDAVEDSGLCPRDNTMVSLLTRLGRHQGMILLDEAVNGAIADAGHEPTYPAMTQGTDLCGFDAELLESLRGDASESGDLLRAESGPCPDEEGVPMTISDAERAAWEAGIEQGLEEAGRLLEIKLSYLW